MKTPVDLGMPYEGPAMPVGMSDKDEEHFPIFHYHGEEDLDLPMEGEMVIKYCVKRAVSSKDEDGEHTYDCDIAVEKILKVKGEKSEAPARSGSDAADALDKIAKMLNKEKDDVSSY